MCVPVLSLTEPVGLHAAPDDSKVNLSVHVHSNELLAMKRTHSMVTVGGLVAAIALCVSGGVIGTFVALILMGILLLTASGAKGGFLGYKCSELWSWSNI